MSKECDSGGEESKSELVQQIMAAETDAVRELEVAKTLETLQNTIASQNSQDNLEAQGAKLDEEQALPLKTKKFRAAKDLRHSRHGTKKPKFGNWCVEVRDDFSCSDTSKETLKMKFKRIDSDAKDLDTERDANPEMHADVKEPLPSSTSGKPNIHE